MLVKRMSPGGIGILEVRGRENGDGLGKGKVVKPPGRTKSG